MIGLSRVSINDRPHRVQFQRPGQPIPDGTGYTQSWIPLPPDEYVNIKPATQASLERLTAGTVLSTATDIVTVPYRQGLTTKTRIVYEDPQVSAPRYLSILDINDPDERHVELVLVCAEIVE